MIETMIETKNLVVDEEANQELLLRFGDHPNLDSDDLEKWYQTIDTRKYKAYWSWLMPLVIKINTLLPLTDVEICGKTCIIVVNDNIIFSNTENNEIEAVYKSVVEFVKWYNENK